MLAGEVKPWERGEGLLFPLTPEPIGGEMGGRGRSPWCSALLFAYFV